MGTSGFQIRGPYSIPRAHGFDLRYNKLYQVGLGLMYYRGLNVIANLMLRYI